MIRNFENLANYFIHYEGTEIRHARQHHLVAIN